MEVVQQSQDKSVDAPAEFETVVETVFDSQPTADQLQDALNNAMSAAFQSGSTLRIRGASRNC
jgi:hypothetical protein